MENIQRLSLLFNPRKTEEYSFCPLLSFDGTYYSLEEGAMPVAKTIEGTLHIVFPTPSSKQKNLVHYTQDLIAKESIGAEQVVLDLRGNIGGNFNLFYNSLYAILPYNELIMKGDRNGCEIAYIRDKNNRLTIEYDGDTIFDVPVISCKKLNLPVTVLVNERSMSSSQLLAIILGYRGSAPMNYTNGSIYEPSLQCCVMGYNFKHGDTVYSGLPTTTVKRIPICDNMRGFSGGLSLGHLRAIVNNEVFADTYHFFYSFSTKPDKVQHAVSGLIKGRFWIFIPYQKQQLPIDWKKLMTSYDGKMEIVLDLRGYRQKGEMLLQSLAPFLPHPAFFKQTKIEADRPKRQITILIDNKFGHHRDPESTLALAYFCKYHRVYGKPRANFEYIFKPHKSPGCPLVVKIPVTKLKIAWKPCTIPKNYLLSE